MVSLQLMKYTQYCFLFRLEIMRYAILGVLLLCFTCHKSSAQTDRFQQIRNELSIMSVEYPGLDEPVNLRVSGSTLKAFITAIANTHGLNVSVANNVEGEIVNNFTNATVIDVFIFLCQEYSLKIVKVGESIISFRNYEEIIPPKEYVSKELKIDYADTTHFISMDLKNDSLLLVAKEITKKSLVNVIIDPALKNEQVSVFIQNRPLESALEMLAFSNGMKMRKDNNFYVLEKAVSAPETNNKNRGRSNVNYVSGNNNSSDLSLAKSEDGRISISAKNVPMIDVISEAAKELNKNYFVASEIKGDAHVYIENATFDELMGYLLSGTEYSFNNHDGVYLIGEKGMEGMKANKVIPIKNRVVEKISDLLPTYLKQGVEIMEYVGTNSLIVSGPALKVFQLEKLVEDLDQIVPNVLISVMILDVQKSNSFSTGVQAGIGTSANPTTSTNGTLIDEGGVNLSVSSESINNLINGINGLGVINIGAVNPNIYMSISAMERNGILKVNSTPSISALNGVEASLSIGETDYYFEANNSLVPINNGGTGQTAFTNSGVYKPLNANLTVKIRPIVTSEEYVTLEITVDQKDFTERVGDTGPIGTVNRTFTSEIRVKNGEMLLLGGLDRKSMSDSGSGIPGLTKVPLLKRIFGKRTKDKSKSKLTLLIKPSVSY